MPRQAGRSSARKTKKAARPASETLAEDRAVSLKHAGKSGRAQARHLVSPIDGTNFPKKGLPTNKSHYHQRPLAGHLSNVVPAPGCLAHSWAIFVFTSTPPTFRINRRKPFGAIFSCSASCSNLTHASKFAGLNLSPRVSQASWVMLYPKSSADHLPTPASEDSGFRPSAGTERSWHRSLYTASNAYSTFIFSRLSALRTASAAELAAMSPSWRFLLLLDTAAATRSAVRSSPAWWVWPAIVLTLFPSVLLGMSGLVHSFEGDASNESARQSKSATRASRSAPTYLLHTLYHFHFSGFAGG